MVIEMTPQGMPLTDGTVVEPVPPDTRTAPEPVAPVSTMWREEPEDDPVDHPAHYTEGRRFEPIDVIEDWELGFHLGNALKYISRAGRKGDAREDLEKAVWYLNREIARLGGERR